MLPQGNNIASKQATKNEGQSSGGNGGVGVIRPQEQTQKCPRCDSPNTKFCYYNNYSLTQPRYFCKACRRYWTKGGALRSIPIGGGCRKNKKTKSSSIDSCSFHGLSAMDLLSFPGRVAASSQFRGGPSSSSSNPSFVNLDPLGFNSPFHQTGLGFANFHEMGTCNMLDIDSSMASLSSINQDLHWKLQQQRLAILFDHQRQKKETVLESQDQKLEPILFQNLEISKPTQLSMNGDSIKDSGGGGGGLATEWFFDNSCAPENLNTAIPTNSNSAGNDQSGSINYWNGVQAWNHLNQHNAVP